MSNSKLFLKKPFLCESRATIYRLYSVGIYLFYSQHARTHNRILPETFTVWKDTVAWSAGASRHLLKHCKTLPCVRWTNQGWACKKKAENSQAALHLCTCQGVTWVSACNHVHPATRSHPVIHWSSCCLVLYSVWGHRPCSERSTTPSLIWDIGLGEALIPKARLCFKNWNLSEFSEVPCSAVCWTTTGHNFGSSSFFSEKIQRNISRLKHKRSLVKAGMQ